MHIDGFRQTLSRVINAYAKENNYIKKDDPNLTNDDLKAYVRKDKYKTCRNDKNFVNICFICFFLCDDVI